MEKPELRVILKNKRDSIEPRQRHLWDQQLHSQLFELEQYQQADLIMLYLSFGTEVNTWPILDHAWQMSKHVAVPKIRKYPKEIIAVKITDKNQLQPGVWGISEPISGTVIEPKHIDLIIVPGLAFNQEGYRIGYGGGYYDRFLPQVRGYKVGLCHPPFLVDIPVYPWDQPVDQVIVPPKGRSIDKKDKVN